MISISLRLIEACGRSSLARSRVGPDDACHANILELMMRRARRVASRLISKPTLLSLTMNSTAPPRARVRRIVDDEDGLSSAGGRQLAVPAPSEAR